MSDVYSESTKYKVSITLCGSVIGRLLELKRRNPRVFRNKSHLIEFAVDEFLKKRGK